MNLRNLMGVPVCNSVLPVPADYTKIFPGEFIYLKFV